MCRVAYLPENAIQFILIASELSLKYFTTKTLK